MKLGLQINQTQEITPLPHISSCPHCSSTSIFRNGHKNSKQQYKCKQCNKNFFATTGTPIHGLHLTDKIKVYTEALMQGLSIRAAAKKTGISNKTSFSWRHKFISSITNESLLKESNDIKTVAIIDTPYSDKGRKKAPEKNRRNSTTIIQFSKNQLFIKKLDSTSIIKQVANILSIKNIIHTTKNKELTIFKKRLHNNNLLHNKKMKIKLNTEINLHRNNLILWMKRFRGVATKYLQQYWNWYSRLQNIEIFKTKELLFLRLCTENQTLALYRQLRNT